jgi:hypothetical protein
MLRNEQWKLVERKGLWRSWGRPCACRWRETRTGKQSRRAGARRLMIFGVGEGVTALGIVGGRKTHDTGEVEAAAGAVRWMVEGDAVGDRVADPEAVLVETGIKIDQGQGRRKGIRA